MTQVANLIVTKMGNDFEIYWSTDQDIVAKTWELLHDTVWQADTVARNYS